MDKTGESHPVLEFFDTGLLGQQVHTGGMVYEVILKLRPANLLAIIKVMGPDGYYVAFVGGGGVLSLLRKVRGAVKSEKTKWRPDKFRPT